MTVQEWLQEQLENNGLFWSDIAEVIERIKQDKNTRGIQWDSPKEHYPDILYPSLLSTAAQHALAWIDEKHPQAWFRPVFAEMAGEQ